MPNSKQQKFQQLLALIGLNQQQEQSQSALQQQIAFHQMGLEQQQAEARQMEAWRQSQLQEATNRETNRSGEFWGGTLPAEYAKVQEMAAGRQGTHADSVAALQEQQTAHDQMLKAQVLEHYGTLMPDQQTALRPFLRSQYPWFAQGDDAIHAQGVANGLAFHAPRFLALKKPEEQNNYLAGVADPDVQAKLKGMMAPVAAGVVPTAQHFGVSTDLAPIGSPTPAPASPIPGTLDYRYQQQQGMLPSSPPSLTPNQRESARAAQTRRLLEAAGITAN